MASLTRHHHTEQFSGILTTNTYLALTSKGREGWEKTKAQKALTMYMVCDVEDL